MYTGFPDIAEELEIFSISADDAIGGTGAREVIVSNLLDENFNRMPDITVSLNGTTPVSVNAGQTYIRASRMIVTLSGSSQRNVGEITLRHKTTTANVFAVMPASAGQTQIFNFTVPAGYKFDVFNGYISVSRASGAAGSIDLDLQLKSFGSNTFRTLRPLPLTTSGQFLLGNGLIFPEKSDFRSRLNSVSDNGTNVSCFIEGMLRKIT